MNYIAEINAFYEIFLPQNPISANAQALWHRLMAYCSKFGWKENFTLVNKKLIEEVKFHTSNETKDSNDSAEDDAKKEKVAKTRALERARNTLIQKGLIKYKKGSGNQCGSYTMISIAPPKKESDFVAQSVVQSVAQSVVQKVDNVLPLDKLNYTKLNKTNIESDTRARTHESETAIDESGFDDLAAVPDYIASIGGVAELRECGDLYMHASGRPITPTMAADIRMRLEAGVEVALIKEWILLSADKNNPATYYTKLAQSYYARGIKTYADYISAQGGFNAKGIEITKPKSEMTQEEFIKASGLKLYKG